ncbi:MAG: hypothetical protein H6811_08330 [Phycisphaeraceae bacterium]|nr:hypothetical protein [Phycisphaeraceae bacterium]
MRALVLALVCAASSGAFADPHDQRYFSSFEGIESSDFVLGDVNVGETAHFSGDAFSGFRGIFELYRTGIFGWMVRPQGTGVIEFDPPAKEAEFYARTRSIANGPTTITAFDEGGAMVGEVTLPAPSAWTLVLFQGRIARIEVFNGDTHALESDGMNSMDDFGFTPVCLADIDGDGDADSDDFFGFLDLFVAGDDRADLDGDGDRDADDFFLYLDAFAAGC